MTLTDITDALRVAQGRGLLPTRLGTAELRELGAGILARSVFSARAVNGIYVGELKKIVDALVGGSLSEGQARTALAEILEVLNYDVEAGGFPGEELEPALEGTLQDFRSFRRRDLIVRTQRDLMQGAGVKMRGTEPDRLATFPAWELVRNLSVDEARDWAARWVIAGGNTTPIADAHKAVGARTNMIALKGDPIWGELGGSGNFSDALDVDHPPFCFNSGMGWREVSAAEVRAAGVTGPDGMSAVEFFESEPATLAGPQPLPSPQVSMRGVDPAILAEFRAATKAELGDKPYVFRYDDILAKELATAERGRE